MNSDKDDTRDSGLVVGTPAPPRLIWLLLPLAAAAGLLVWGVQSGRPDANRMWTATRDLADRAAAPPQAADSAPAVIAPLPLLAMSVPTQGQGVVSGALEGVDSSGAVPAVAPLAPEGRLFAGGVPTTATTADIPASQSLAAANDAPGLSRTVEVPPEVALVSALRAGQLQPATPGDFERWKARYASVNNASLGMSLGELTGGTSAYVIRRDFEFPSGLHGAHSALFLVQPGVPFPRGDPGHSMVLDMNTGACVGFRCLGLRD